MPQSSKPPSLLGGFLFWLVLSAIFIIVLQDNIGWGVVASYILLTIFSTVYIYDHAKAYGRNAVAWATVFVVFSPIWGAIFYLLSWPKNAKQQTPGIKKKGGEGREVTKWYCDECGSRIRKSDKFCASCGIEFAQED